jgi:hypothetical protein
VIFCRFWLIFNLKGDFFERVGGTTFLAERVGGYLNSDRQPTMLSTACDRTINITKNYETFIVHLATLISSLSSHLDGSVYCLFLRSRRPQNLKEFSELLYGCNSFFGHTCKSDGKSEFTNYYSSSWHRIQNKTRILLQ